MVGLVIYSNLVLEIETGSSIGEIVKILKYTFQIRLLMKWYGNGNSALYTFVCLQSI